MIGRKCFIYSVSKSVVWVIFQWMKGMSLLFHFYPVAWCGFVYRFFFLYCKWCWWYGFNQMCVLSPVGLWHHAQSRECLVYSRVKLKKNVCRLLPKFLFMSNRWGFIKLYQHKNCVQYMLWLVLFIVLVAGRSLHFHVCWIMRHIYLITPEFVYCRSFSLSLSLFQVKRSSIIKCGSIGMYPEWYLIALDLM